MYTVVTPQQMRELEARAFSLGVPSLLLMEDAARAAQQIIAQELHGVKDKDILYLAGKGNNGGDGLAMARLCLQGGGKPRVLLLGMPETPDAQSNLSYIKALNIPVALLDEPAAQESLLRAPDAVVDAVFGIGFHGCLPAALAQLSTTIADWQVPVFAVDIPSGMDGQTGRIAGGVIAASHTLAIGHLKTGHCLSPHLDALGKVHLLPLGIPEAAYQALKGQSVLAALEAGDLPGRLPARSRNAHKGDTGRVLLYMGSAGMAGAAGMAALACLRAGAGLVTLACEPGILPILQTLVPNAMCLPVEQACTTTPRHDVLALGSGLGQSEGVWEHILALWHPDRSSVWDADALNLLACQPMKLGDRAVITPHPGEAARLLDVPLAQILNDPLGSAQALQKRYDCTVVLKSACTVICDRQRTALNILGSPALSKGGSGDALTGILAGLMAQQPDASGFETARTACLWLGLAGRLAEENYGIHGALTSEVIACMYHAAKL